MNRWQPGVESLFWVKAFPKPDATPPEDSSQIAMDMWGVYFACITHFVHIHFFVHKAHFACFVHYLQERLQDTNYGEKYLKSCKNYSYFELNAKIQHFRENDGSFFSDSEGGFFFSAKRQLKIQGEKIVTMSSGGLLFSSQN